MYPCGRSGRTVRGDRWVGEAVRAARKTRAHLRLDVLVQSTSNDDVCKNEESQRLCMETFNRQKRTASAKSANKSRRSDSLGDVDSSHTVSTVLGVQSDLSNARIASMMPPWEPKQRQTDLLEAELGSSCLELLRGILVDLPASLERNTSIHDLLERLVESVDEVLRRTTGGQHRLSLDEGSPNARLEV